MLLDFYSLKEQPFGVTPDPRYLYFSETHREALASLSYGIRTGRGFMSIIAQPGMGKTTLLFQLLQQLQQSARTVFLFQTLCGPEDLLRSLLHDLGHDASGEDIPAMHSRLNEYIVAESRKGRRLVVVVDEAQNLTDAGLELLRMLSNFEKPGEKMMQIILAGQPQLAHKLASSHLVQLRQRISIVARLKPLSLEETNLYVGHRLHLAGYDFGESFFTPRAGEMIAEYSGGIPRNINNLCFNALSLGYALKKKPIDERVLREVIEDLDLNSITEETSSTGEQPKPARRISGLAAKAANAGTTGRAWLSKCAAVMAVLTVSWPMGAGYRSLNQPASPRMSTEISSTQLLPSASTTSRSDVPSVAEMGTERDVPQIKIPLERSEPAKMFAAGLAAANSSHYREVEPDPAELWKQVRNDNTGAELALANLYLDGRTVPQNCPQARVLISAASKKRNAGAEKFMAAYSKRCR